MTFVRDVPKLGLWALWVSQGVKQLHFDIQGQIVNGEGSG